MIELSDNDRPFITHIIAGPNGLIGQYRKTHLSPVEKNIYLAGNNLSVYSCNNTLFGIQLCYEAHFPEISTVMALMGADIIFIPHASPKGDPQGKLNSWLRHLRARAFDNGVFIVACNQVGENREGFLFPGVAVVLGPDGRVMTSYAGESEKILFVELKKEILDNVRQHRMKYFLPQRRPDLYRIALR
jgi:N-carbamoylputrescine amidase